ncbi:MAG: hypothetical protein CMB17_03165 [Euryarchaeota archaeon]|nr:hypothetical protein [Euryarchaeota archaeon]
MAMKRRSRDRRTRLNRADQAISHLENIIIDSSLDIDIRNSAAEDIFRTCMRHNRTIPESVKSLICRGCKGILIPGETARVRIRNRIRITTCLTCSRERRLPLYPGVLN